MTVEEYYTPPSDEVFEDVRQAATKVWQTYDDTYQYATGKINRIKDLKNVQDNTAYMIAMFDYQNKMKLFDLLTLDSSREYFKNVMQEELNNLFV